MNLHINDQAYVDQAGAEPFSHWLLLSPGAALPARVFFVNSRGKYR